MTIPVNNISNTRPIYDEEVAADMPLTSDLLFELVSRQSSYYEFLTDKTTSGNDSQTVEGHSHGRNSFEGGYIKRFGSFDLGHIYPQSTNDVDSVDVYWEQFNTGYPLTNGLEQAGSKISLQTPSIFCNKDYKKIELKVLLKAESGAAAIAKLALLKNETVLKEQEQMSAASTYTPYTFSLDIENDDDYSGWLNLKLTLRSSNSGSDVFIAGDDPIFKPASSQIHGGAQIPFYIATEIGDASASFCRGNENNITLGRSYSFASNDYYWQSSTPHPVVSSTTGSCRRLVLAGNVVSKFDNGHFLTTNDANVNGRYRYKKAIYDTDSDTTIVLLLDDLPQNPISGALVYIYRQLGDKRIFQFLPDWANRFSVMFRAGCTITSVTTDGEYHFSLGSGNTNWAMRARLVSGTTKGEWVNFLPQSNRSTAWTRLSIDTSNFTKDTIHVFEIELEYNSEIEIILPITLSSKDTLLWFEGANEAMKSKFLSILTRD